MKHLCSTQCLYMSSVNGLFQLLWDRYNEEIFIHNIHLRTPRDYLSLPIIRQWMPKLDFESRFVWIQNVLFKDVSLIFIPGSKSKSERMNSVCWHKIRLLQKNMISCFSNNKRLLGANKHTVLPNIPVGI